MSLNADAEIKCGYFTLNMGVVPADEICGLDDPMQPGDRFVSLCLRENPSMQEFAERVPAYFRMVADVIRAADVVLAESGKSPTGFVCALTYKKLARVAVGYGFQAIDYGSVIDPESAGDIDKYYQLSGLGQKGIPNPGYDLIVQPAPAFIERWGDGPIPSAPWRR